MTEQARACFSLPGVTVRRMQGIGGSIQAEPDSVLIEVNGGMNAENGTTISIEIPLGHSVDDVWIQASTGNGWISVKPCI